MLLTLVLTIIIVGLLIAGMSIGVILQKKPIKGTCGGLSALGMDTDCDICGGDRSKCDEENNSPDTDKNDLDKLAYDATKTDAE